MSALRAMESESERMKKNIHDKLFGIKKYLGQLLSLFFPLFEAVIRQKVLACYITTEKRSSHSIFIDVCML